MYIFDIENKSYLKDVLIDNLKTLGVRCRLPKKLKVIILFALIITKCLFRFH